MSSIHSFQKIRRGAVIALYGFALSFFAVLLSARTTSGIIVGNSNPYSLVLETIAGWGRTPLGLFEVLAYIGLVIAILGLIRYWIVEPLLNWLNLEHDPDGSGFEFGNGSSTAEGDDIERENLASGHDSPAVPGHTRHEFGDQESFVAAPGAEVAESDFLRSPGDGDSSSEGESDEAHGNSVLAEVKYREQERTSGENSLISDGAIEVSLENPDTDDGSAVQEALGLNAEDDSAKNAVRVDELDESRQSIRESSDSTGRRPQSNGGSRRWSKDVSERVTEATSDTGELPISSTISAIKEDGENLANTLEEAFDFDTTHIDRAIDAIDESRARVGYSLSSLREL